MYNYIDFDFNFTFNKAMNEKVPGDRGDLLSAQVSKILIAALYFFYDNKKIYELTNKWQIE